MRKFSSILFLGLLLLNVVGYTLLTAWNSWEAENSIDASKLLEFKGDTLVFKYSISLPYRGNFEQELSQKKTAIYEGKFYLSSRVEYKNDTLITYYEPVNYTRENVMSIIKNFSDVITQDFSKKDESSSQKALEFFKKISKDYYSQNLVVKSWFWIEFNTQKYTFDHKIYLNPDTEGFSLPPRLLG